MKRTMSLTIIGLLIVFGGIFGFYNFKQYMIGKFFASYAPPPQVVSTIQAKAVTWQPFLTAVGNMTAIQGVDVSPEVGGQVKHIYFQSGQHVTKGMPLFQMDDATEQAQLSDIRAQLQLAQTNLQRAQRLFSQKVTTQSALDDSATKVKQLQANFENIESQISKKLVRAPFDGNIGISQIHVGQVVSAGQVSVSLQSIHALYSQFVLPQKDIRNIQVKQAVKVTTDTYPNESFDGYISAIDSKVDDSTRTIEVQATIDNSFGKLYPGMFVNLKLFLPPLPNTVVVPQTAVTYTLYGDSAFVVTLTGKQDEKNHNNLGIAKRVFVKTSDKQDNTVVVSEGIKAGDIVVDSGQSKILEDGATIAINNSNPL